VEEMLIWLLKSVEPLRSETPRDMETPALWQADCSCWRSWEGEGLEEDEDESKTTKLSCAYFARTGAYFRGG
jgi:hypothetical protein